MLKSLMVNTIYIIGLVLFITVFVKLLDYNQQEIIERNKRYQEELADMSIPPKLTAIQNDPGWTIKHWISADRLHADCKTAHEYMNENILEKRVTRNGKTKVYSIFDYLSSCKTASKRAYELVFPQARKWCHYRKMEPRLEVLCSEWEAHGATYLKKIDADYLETESRFKSMTNGYYNDRL